MAYIYLIEKSENYTIGSAILTNCYKSVDRILINQKFIDYFELDFGRGCFEEDFFCDDLTVEFLIKWIEKKLELKIKKESKYKYECSLIKFAVKKLLPKIKKWNKYMKISIESNY